MRGVGREMRGSGEEGGGGRKTNEGEEGEDRERNGLEDGI